MPGPEAKRNSRFIPAPISASLALPEIHNIVVLQGEELVDAHDTLAPTCVVPSRLATFDKILFSQLQVSAVATPVCYSQPLRAFRVVDRNFK